MAVVVLLLAHKSDVMTYVYKKISSVKKSEKIHEIFVSVGGVISIKNPMNKFQVNPSCTSCGHKQTEPKLI